MRRGRGRAKPTPRGGFPSRPPRFMTTSISASVSSEFEPGTPEFDDALCVTVDAARATLPPPPNGCVYEAVVTFEERDETVATFREQYGYGPGPILSGGTFASPMPHPDRQRITDRIPPEILNTLGATAGQTAHASTTRHWQSGNGRDIIVQEIDVETKTESLPCSEARGCCHEGLEGRLGASSRQCTRDLPGPERENARTYGDGEHSECSDSHTSQSEECRHHDNSPCDCCRHGHSLTSFIRSPDDCRTCFRHMGSGGFVNPKYPQIRQRMLKTLNQRRDHSEDSPDATKAKTKATPPPTSVNSIPCGKKEWLIIPNPENFKADVDDAVRMIEGTEETTEGTCTDPRKAAKKARQKERKIQSKVEEDLRREEEQRKIKEEEERIRRVKEEKEEEERRKAEELKRQARRVKKKNRKKKDAATMNSAQSVLLKADADERQNESSLHISVTGKSSRSETVRKVLETANPLNDAGNTDKPRMVTIRRHPATHDNQNVVTITLSDDKEGKSPVYMLLNGHLVSSKSFAGAKQTQDGNPTVKNDMESSTSDKKKKKNKKKQPQLKSQCNPHGEPCYSLPERDTGSGLPSQSVNIPDSPASTPLFRDDNHSIHLENLSLPPGITITKVPSPRKGEGFAISPGSNVSQYRVPSDQELFYVDDDDDFFGRKETQEFEEVINKTRRKKMKAARTSNDRDGSEETEARESPNNTKHLTRRAFISDSKAVEKPIESPKVVNNGKGMTKTATSFKKMNGNYTSDHQNGVSKPRRDHTTFRHDVFPTVSHSQVPVMPRLHRAHLKNKEGSGIPHGHVGNTSNDGKQAYSSFNDNNNQSLNGVTVSERNYTNAPLTSPQQQQQFVGSHGNGATSVGAPPHSSWGQVTAPQLSHQPSLSVQTEHEQEGPWNSWNPWKDWSEHSTPEHPSRLGGEDQFYRDTHPPKTFAFHELNQKSKSPIQRPTHNPLEGNSTQLNGNFPRDLPSTPSHPYAPFQSTNFEESCKREAIFRYNQYQMQQRQAQAQQNSSLASYPINLQPFNGQRTSMHPTDEEKSSWNTFSGAQPSAYLLRRPSDTGDFILTQPNPSPNSMRGKSGDISWEPYSGKNSPLHDAAERLHKLRLSPLADLTDHLQPIPATAMAPGYRMGGFDQPASGFFGNPRSDWQMGPSPARNLSAKTFQQSPDSYNWELGPSFHSRYTGGGAV